VIIGIASRGFRRFPFEISGTFTLIFCEIEQPQEIQKKKKLNQNNQYFEFSKS
jgi:hypothetical protein